MQIVKSFFVATMLLVPFLKTYASNLKDSASIGFNTYTDSGDVQVYSPTISLMKTLSKKFLIGFKMRVDAIAAASIRNGGSPQLVDTVTGASAKKVFDDVRYAPTLLMAYDDNTNAVSGGAYYSSENDYVGKALFFNYTRQLNEENTALSVGVSQSDDKWTPLFDRKLDRSDRKEFKADVSINQLISPSASIQFVYSYMQSEGFLSSPYHYVKQDEFARFEKYPEARVGHAFAIKGVFLLNNANALNYGYRYYSDDWKIASHTVHAEWMSDVTRTFTSGLRLRYYTQSKAVFAKEVGGYDKRDDFFAVDYRMSAFDSYDIGIPFIYKPSVTSGVKVTASVDYYQTSDNAYIKQWYGINNLKALYTTLNIAYEF